MQVLRANVNKQISDICFQRIEGIKFVVLRILEAIVNREFSFINFVHEIQHQSLILLVVDV